MDPGAPPLQQQVTMCRRAVCPVCVNAPVYTNVRRFLSSARSFTFGLCTLPYTGFVRVVLLLHGKLRLLKRKETMCPGRRFVMAEATGTTSKTRQPNGPCVAAPYWGERNPLKQLEIRKRTLFMRFYRFNSASSEYPSVHRSGSTNSQRKILWTT